MFSIVVVLGSFSLSLSIAVISVAPAMACGRQESSSAVAVSPANRGMCQPFQLANVLSRRAYRCKQCDSEKPLALVLNMSNTLCMSCLKPNIPKYIESIAGCADCPAIVCASCIFEGDLAVRAAGFEQWAEVSGARAECR